MNAADLTRRPPRSPRVLLGGYTILPRILDKARATLAGQAGEYKYGNPLDLVLFGFIGVESAEFLARVKTGAGDSEMLDWVNARSRKSPHEIAAWSEWTGTFADNDLETREWMTGRIRALAPRRADIQSLFDYLDLDDHVSFGGQG